MKPRSLRRALALPWMTFAATLMLGIGLVAALALYILEDSFIDERLIQAEARLASGSASPQSDAVTLHAWTEVPPDLQAHLVNLPVGAMRELRLADGRYVHVRVIAPDAAGPRILLLDAGDVLRVSVALWRIAPWASVLLALVLLAAAALAQRSARRIERAASGLLAAVDSGADTGALRHAAQAQPVGEFHRLGLALADALDARLATLAREEETLRFLAHELRTPLHSARLAVAVVLTELRGSEALLRLQRALQRLERANAAVLWLGEQVPDGETSSPAQALTRLAEELAPLARQREQRFRLDLGSDATWTLPAAAAEAIAGNLLLNAIQHGGPGEIRVELDSSGLSISNGAGSGTPDAGGFGLGLVLSRRLLERIGWTLELQAQQGVVRASPPNPSL